MHHIEKPTQRRGRTLYCGTAKAFDLTYVITVLFIFFNHLQKSSCRIVSAKFGQVANTSVVLCLVLKPLNINLYTVRGVMIIVTPFAEKQNADNNIVTSLI